jgi:stress response protein YsnF
MSDRPDPYLAERHALDRPRIVAVEAERRDGGAMRIPIVHEVVRVERVARAYEELSFETRLVTDRVPVKEYVTHEDVEVRRQDVEEPV